MDTVHTAAFDEELTRLRRDIHAHPETAFEEHRTAELVAAKLEEYGVEAHRGLAGTGVVGRLQAGSSGRAVGLRADMDALPLTERNEFEHRSRHAGKMHACGHDGHVAMLLGAARRLAQTRAFDGTVYFIFQPAEEGQGGGRVMVEQGLFDRFPMQSVFGLHNWPGLPEGSFAVHDGPCMAAADEFEILVLGRGAHAAMPQQGVDPVSAGASLVQALQSVVSRETDPLDSAVITVTQFHAGDAYNVIPDRAVLRGTARSFKPAVQEAIEAGIRRVAAGIGAATRTAIEVGYRRGYPPTINSSGEAAVCREVAAALVGADRVYTSLAPSMGAEDFSFMLQARPGCYVWLGSGARPGGCLLHSPYFDFNDAVIPTGVAYWVRLTERLLGASSPA